MHPWFTDQSKIEGFHNSFSPQIFDRLKAYRGITPLKNEALHVLVKMLDANQLEGLNKAFEEIDLD
jgi:hypothetical protein